MENTFGMDRGKLASEIAKINWFDTFNFGDGVVTPGYDNTYKRIRTLQMLTPGVDPDLERAQERI